METEKEGTLSLSRRLYSEGRSDCDIIFALMDRGHSRGSAEYILNSLTKPEPVIERLIGKVFSFLTGGWLK